MVYHGSETLSSLAPKIWQFIPNSLKKETTLAVFKNKIMTCNQNHNQCPCRLCKKYIEGRIGFI